MNDNTGKKSATLKVSIDGIRKVSITGEFIRLDSLLKFASVVSSGGEAKTLIQSGMVFVDGQVCDQRGKKVRKGNIVRCGSDALIVK